MEGNNIVSQGIEQLGVRTFNQSEMAFSILGLLAPEIIAASQRHPLWADMTGGMLFIENMKATISEIRSQITEQAEITKAIKTDFQLDEALLVNSQGRPIKV
jgi:fatty acid synthase subunit alpha